MISALFLAWSGTTKAHAQEASPTPLGLPGRAELIFANDRLISFDFIPKNESKLLEVLSKMPDYKRAWGRGTREIRSSFDGGEFKLWIQKKDGEPTVYHWIDPALMVEVYGAQDFFEAKQ